MMAHATDAPLIFVLLAPPLPDGSVRQPLGQQLTSKFVAVLGVLTAVNAVAARRAWPGRLLGGVRAAYSSPVTLRTGLRVFCWGRSRSWCLRWIGGGVGPWLPYQMFATGWMGLLSGLLPSMRRLGRAEPVVLAGWGLVLGLIFGRS